MGEVFTRKFIELDGDPVVGASLRLVSLTWPVAVPCDLFEIVSTDPEEQGCYYSSAGLTGTQTELDPGVYRIDIYNGSNWVPFSGVGGSEVTISPGRTLRADASGSFLRFIVENDQLRVTSLMGDDVGLALSDVQAALTAASTAGLKKVVVGKYRHVAVWQGSGYLTIPDGLTLDLCGAEIRSLLNAPVLEFSGAGTVCNGTVAIAGGTRAANTLAGNLVVFENIRFVRSGQAAPTAASSTNAETPVSFIGCTNVTLAPPVVGAVVRKQSAVGCNGVYEVGNATDVAQVANANATGAEVGAFVQTALDDIGSAPSVTPPFAGTAEAAEAVKQMWFDKIPSLEADVAALASSGYEQFSWQGGHYPALPNGDLGSGAYTITPTNVVVVSSSLINVERKLVVYGAGINKRIRVSVAMTLSAVMRRSNSAIPIGAAEIAISSEMGDAMAAVQVEYPGAINIFDEIADGGRYLLYTSSRCVRLVSPSGTQVMTAIPSLNSVGTKVSAYIADLDIDSMTNLTYIYQVATEIDAPFHSAASDISDRATDGSFASLIQLQTAAL